MKTPTASSATSSQREQTSLLSQMPRSPRSNVCSTPDPESPSASVHRKRFSTPSLTLKFLCAGKLNPRSYSPGKNNAIRIGEAACEHRRCQRHCQREVCAGGVEDGRHGGFMLRGGVGP